jgi:DNA-binding NarL/FixJ family response regulator
VLTDQVRRKRKPGLADQLVEMSEKAEQIKILVVDDHPLSRVGLKYLLEEATDMTIVGEAMNGQQAVASVEEHKPNVVLMDVGMPVMDGIQASKAIREKFPQTRIIMLTSHDSEEDIFASLAAGASGYCLKDINQHRLFSAIRSVHAGDFWLDTAIAGKVVSAISSSRIAWPSQGQNQSGVAENLSQRELEVLNLLVEGLSNQQIADRLVIGLETVKTHIKHILDKLAVSDRTQAAIKALRDGIV